MTGAAGGATTSYGQSTAVQSLAPSETQTAFSAAMSGLLEAAREANEKGSFGYLERSLTTPELNAFMEN